MYTQTRITDLCMTMLCHRMFNNSQTQTSPRTRVKTCPEDLDFRISQIRISQEKNLSFSKCLVPGHCRIASGVVAFVKDAQRNTLRFHESFVDEAGAEDLRRAH